MSTFGAGNNPGGGGKNFQGGSPYQMQVNPFANRMNFMGGGRLQDPGFGMGGQNMGNSVIQQLQQPLQQYQQQGYAPALYQQYQNAAPGAAQDAIVKQMQGSDAGAGFNQAMKSAGYGLNQQGGGQFSYSPMAGTAPPGSLSASIQAMQQGNPNAQNMLRQNAGLPGQQNSFGQAPGMFGRMFGGNNGNPWGGSSGWQY